MMDFVQHRPRQPGWAHALTPPRYAGTSPETGPCLTLSRALLQVHDPTVEIQSGACYNAGACGLWSPLFMYTSDARNSMG